MTPSKQPEPDKPRPDKKLRTGFSTGTAAAAAALAAALALRDGRIPDRVTVSLPGGKKLTIPVFEGQINGPVRTVVVKDAGDDPDVTNKAHIGVILEERPGELSVVGGSGVGLVTKPGLVLPPGEWAINPVPRQMIRDNLAPFLPEVGLKVTVFIRDGEKLAQKTLNPRLGIVGGLSVLGTTGLVKPFSHSAYVATIDSALSVARAMGLSEIVLTTGGRSERLARDLRPDLPPEAFVQMADYFQAALDLAVKKGFERIGLAVFFGKAVKQAAGFSCTHAHKSDMDLQALAGWLSSVPENVRADIARAPTALAALDILKTYRQTASIRLVAQKMVQSARNLAGPEPDIWAQVMDFDGTVLAMAN
ncbi:MAG: cobalt-precorrin-5B (C(1))-methyltransferase CbiD [Deltaproteobacteria bacterium]|jgi:cobalt-precorrin-5B (C1)-methyltransferase|nr:cobalt-precorrin-5B (C(1))-methyltransferase CbiD [Deltaproteobacteria bacterium]